jgi:hypothetical protein
MHFTDEDETHETLFPKAANDTKPPVPGVVSRTIDCASCFGTGYVNDMVCTDCGGTGKSIVYSVPPAPPAPTPAPASPAPVQGSLIAQVQHPIPEEVDATLAYILSLKRPYGTATEMEFMSWLRGELIKRDVPKEKVRIGALGCLVATLMRPDGKLPTTLFSCHTDTVHHSDGKQKIVYDSNFGHIFLDTGKDAPPSNCLGADDGIGVWLMLEMISAKVPGVYVFHRGEEQGGLGSQKMVEKEEDFLLQFQAAVAFDRPRTNEVITHQRGQRCASDKYATTLSERLNAFGFEFKPSNRGVFTDTANYRKLIHECINLGVGYENQHGTQEFQDYAHAVALRDAVCKIDWETLPIDRDCTAADPVGYMGNGYGSWGGQDRFDEYLRNKYGDSRYGSGAPSPAPQGGGKKRKKSNKQPTAGQKMRDVSTHLNDPQLDPVAEIEGLPFSDLRDWCESNPADAAGLLVDLAAEVVALQEKVRFIRRSL